MKRPLRRVTFILLGVCTLGLAATGCGSKGEFTPYTEGSALTQGKPEEAAFSVSYDAPNEIFHQPRYDLTLAIKDTGKTIKLGFIMDGDFLAPAKDRVMVTASVKDGMTVKTNDVLLQGLLDHVSISLRKTALKNITTYNLEIVLYDEANRVVGSFSDNLIEKAAANLGANIAGTDTRAEEDPTSPTAIYDWIANRARIATQ